MSPEVESREVAYRNALNEAVREHSELEEQERSNRARLKMLKAAIYLLQRQLQDTVIQSYVTDALAIAQPQRGDK